MSAPGRSRALVVGLGRSGSAACTLLARLGIPTHGYDAREGAPCPPNVVGFVGEPQIPAAALAGVDLVVLSPGVPPEPVRARVAELAPHATIEGELGLALGVLNEHTAGAHRTALITGTNGKSTITALLGELVGASGARAFCGGNLGVPLSECVADVLAGAPAPEVLVIECSSFQLETLGPELGIDVAVLCNVTEDHIDRYPDHAAYARTKGRVFAGLRDDGLALVGPDPALLDLVSADVRRRVRTVVVGGDSPPCLRAGALVLDGDDSVAIERDALPLAGRHNATNALFALVAARHLGVATPTAVTALGKFTGLPHRMQFVAERDGVRFYDDSKATNVASVVAGLDGFDRPFVLLAGGRLKGDDLEPLRAVLSQEHARALIGFGEGGPTIVALAPSSLVAKVVDTLPEALGIAREFAQPGDAIVLSPGGASYDQYRNFVERGEHFTALVSAGS